MAPLNGSRTRAACVATAPQPSARAARRTQGAPAPAQTPAPSCRTPAVHREARVSPTPATGRRSRATPLTCPTGVWSSSPRPAAEAASALHGAAQRRCAPRLHVAPREVHADAVAKHARHGVLDGDVRPAAAQRHHLRRTSAARGAALQGRASAAPARPRSAGWRWRRGRAARSRCPSQPPPRPRACRKRRAARGRGRCPSRAHAARVCRASARQDPREQIALSSSGVRLQAKPRACAARATHRGVVSADAEDAAHGEQRRRALHRQRGDGRWRERIRVRQPAQLAQRRSGGARRHARCPPARRLRSAARNASATRPGNGGAQSGDDAEARASPAALRRCCCLQRRRCAARRRPSVRARRR